MLELPADGGEGVIDGRRQALLTPAQADAQLDRVLARIAEQLAAEPGASFAPRFAELRGDILAAQGKTAEARTAYDLALTKFDALARDDENRQRGGYKEVIQTKRDSLGAAK